jgi:RNA polymerase sigma-70 factor (ECF subfamily)
MQNLTADQYLVERMRVKDQSAVTELEMAYRSRIQQLALRYVKNPEDAEEVAQDVLLKVYRKIEAFRGDAALSSWIYRITFNTAMSRLRSQKQRSQVECRPGDLRAFEGDAARRGNTRDIADWSSMADEGVLRSQVRSKVNAALQDLAPIYRVPVVLRDIQGLSTEEASARLGIKVQTLKSRLHRGRLFLRSRLVEFADGLTMHRALSPNSMVA